MASGGSSSTERSRLIVFKLDDFNLAYSSSFLLELWNLDALKID